MIIVLLKIIFILIKRKDDFYILFWKYKKRTILITNIILFIDENKYNTWVDALNFKMLILMYYQHKKNDFVTNVKKKMKNIN